MKPSRCQFCGTTFMGQESICLHCGAPRGTAPQTGPGQEALVFAPPQQPAPRRKTSLWLIAGCSLWAIITVGGIVVALLAGFGVFNPKVDSSLPNTTGPGWWKANAPGLGAFEFKVNNDQSAITEFVFQIPKITCPDITYSVESVEASETPPWSVTNGQFSADVQLDNDPAVIDVAVTGTIVSAGQQASGTWVFDGEGSPCQVNWTGVPSK